MKTVTAHHNNFARRPNIPYPNAATTRQLWNKFIDLLLMGAMGAAGAAILLFIIALS